MPNIFKRAYDSLFSNNGSPRTVVTNHPREYLQSKTVNLGKFDKNRAELNSTVFTCVSIIANSISKFPLHIMRFENGKKVKYTTHPWYDALRYTPFQSVNSQKFYSNGLTNMYLGGNKFYYKQEYDNQLNLNPQLVPLCDPKAIANQNNETWYKFDNVDSWLPAKDLIHFYILSKDGKLGLNPIASIEAELNIQKYGEEGLKAYYENGLFGTLYLTANVNAVVGKPDLQKQREWYDQLQTDFASYRNSGKIPKIDPYFDLKSIPPTQIDFLQNNKYSISQIGALFNVPEAYLGVQNSQTYGKADAAIELFNVCLGNVTAMILAELSQKILSQAERNSGVFLEYDFSSLYQLDLVAKATYVTNLARLGVYSPNEIRQIFGSDVVDNEFMDKHFIQSQNLAIEEYPQWKNNSTELASTGSTQQ